MVEDFITSEVEEEGCGRLQFELPLDITDEEIAHIKSLVPRAESGLLELLDPTRATSSSAAPRCWCINFSAATRSSAHAAPSQPITEEPAQSFSTHLACTLVKLCLAPTRRCAESDCHHPDASGSLLRRKDLDRQPAPATRAVCSLIATRLLLTARTPACAQYP